MFPQPIEVVTRLLLPFHVPSGFDLSAKLALLTWRRSGGDESKKPLRVWDSAQLHPLDCEEMLPEAESFFIGSGSCSRFEVPNGIRDSWFGNVTALVLPGPGEHGASSPIRLDPSYGLEIFVVADSIGVLSIAFRLPCNQGQADTLTLERALAVNYHLSHLRYRVPVFRKPQPERDPHLAPADPGIPASETAATANVCDRLGHRGQPFTLRELSDLLLSTLGAECGREQHQFLTYTTVLFNESVDFSAAATRSLVLPMLSAFAQIEEPRHAAGVAEEIGIPHCTLNAKHLAACSYLGAAHFLANQDPPSKSADTYDSGRVDRVQRKFFTAFLIALAQRVLAHRFLRDASTGMADGKPRVQQLTDIWNRFSRFEANGYLIDVSRREPVNRVFRLAHEAQRVPQTIDALHRIFRDRQAAEQSERQLDLQDRLGRIEFFIVAFYTAEFCNLVGDRLKLDDLYVFAGELAFAFIAGLITHLHHVEPTHVGKPGGWRARQLLWVVVLAFLVWMAVGRFLVAREQTAPIPILKVTIPAPPTRSLTLPPVLVSPGMANGKPGEIRKGK